jgi:hypothetical protein
MAAPTNTFISNSAVGNRESLHNIITVLNKDETPFVSTIGSGDADATYEEWQLDALGNADTNNSNLEATTRPRRRSRRRCASATARRS